MELELKGKKVLITGGSKGIGLACARAFMAEGAKVAIVSRSQANLDAAKKELKDCHCIAGDLVDAAAAARVVEQAERELGPIDVLVNSAGAAKRTNAEDLTPEAWRAAMDAKYFTYINVIDPLVKRMAARGSGVIINIIGSGGKIASPIHLAGGSANAALMLATAGLANAYAARGVRVVGLNPGLTNTSRVSEGLKADAKREGISEEEALARARKKLPLGRLAEPGEIADIAVFAASARGRFLTGANISCDGVSTATVV
jgi:NAD(P)-dependent dehydrogenase (short-subunit alcohol dehydrogenase family)